jgi:FHS family glucose/mannose:H+ symporter-like MFS transporter
MRTEPEAYRGLHLSIFAGAFVFGVVMSSLGSLLPSLTSTLGLQKVDAGMLFLFMNFAMLLGSLVFGPICDRFGFRLLLLASALLISGAFALLSAAAVYGSIVAAVSLLGFAGGALNGGINALLNDISPDRRQSALNLLGIFFGVGALFTPFFIGSLITAIGLGPILVSLSALTLVPFAFFLVAQFPAAKHAGGFKASELRAVLGSPLLYLFGLLLLCESGNEFTVGGWVSSFLEESHGMTASAAAYALAAYWGAVLAGRLAASRIGARISAATLVAAGAILAMISMIGLILSGNGTVAVVFVALAGLGFATIFPTTLAQAGAAFASHSGTAFSVIFVLALCGGMTAPWLVGRIAQNQGIGAGFWVTVASCGAIVLFQALIRRKSGRFTRPA